MAQSHKPGGSHLVKRPTLTEI
eukprot:COSAG01_NODE_9392_length_2459_cov_1.907203_1_plen_21_part_10